MIFRSLHAPSRVSPWLIAGSLIGGGTALIAALYVSKQRAQERIENEEGGRTGEEPDEARTLTIEPIAPPSPGERTPYSPADTEALAWALHSEGASHNDAERKGIAFVIRNYARRVKKPIAVIAPPGTEQLKQPWSTARPANAKDRTDAARFLAMSWNEDRTGGAHKFFEPGAQDELYRRGAAYRADPAKNAQWAKFNKYKSDANGIRARWGKEGNSLLASIGRWEFWGRRSGPMMVAGVEMAVAVLGATKG